jgi:hypothetical protein
MLKFLLHIAQALGKVPSPVASADHAFDREKASFEQNFQQFRHLNEQMNKVPPFAVTLTGGFWYVAVVQHFSGRLDPELEATARFALMIFAAIANVMLIFISIRIRDVMKSYQDKVMEFMDIWKPDSAKQSFLWYRDYSMISMYAVMMLTGSVLSVAGAFFLFWPRTGIPLCYAIGGVGFGFVAIIVASNGMPKWFTRQT